jgi:hypothetical protein
MDWKALNKSKTLKWAIFFVLFFFGLFCFMKDKGYCAEIEIENIIIEQPADFFEGRVPVDQEYLYQYPETPTYSYRSLSLPKLECRTYYGKATPADNRAQRQKWQDAFDMHSFNAIRTYNDAKDCVWYLPNLTWRQWGRDAWVAACAMASTKTPCQALVVAFSTMLSQYGLHCADQWDYIEDKLYWSEYHFNECIKYAQLLQG